MSHALVICSPVRRILDAVGSISIAREMAMRRITIDLFFDAEAGVWVATSRDIQGLAVEGEDLDAIRANVRSAVLDLVEMNGLPRRSFFSRLRERVQLDFRDHEDLVAC